MQSKAPADDILEFTQFLYNGARQFGIKRIKEKIRELYENPGDPGVLRQQILDEIKSVYGVAPNVVMKSKRRGVVTEAKVMAIILIHKHVNMTNVEIGSMFGCGGSLVGRRIKIFNNVSGGRPIRESDNAFSKIYLSRLFLQNFKYIDDRIALFKSQWQKK